MSNEELVICIQCGDPDGTLMTALWNQNQNFVEMIARKYAGMAEMADLEQEGFLGLCRAVERWDPEMGVQFLSYAGYWIRQVMVRYIEKEQRVSTSMQSKIREYKRTVSEFAEEFGREPSDAEICDLMGISENELDEIRKAENGQNMASLDAPVSSEDGDATLGDLTPGDEDPEAETVEKVQNEELAKVIWPMVDELSECQGDLIRRRYQQGEQLSEIGAETGRTVTQASDEIRRGLNELRRPKNRRRLEPFLDDRIFSEALRGNGSQSFRRSWTSSTERIAIRLVGDSGNSDKGRNKN